MIHYIVPIGSSPVYIKGPASWVTSNDRGLEWIRVAPTKNLVVYSEEEVLERNIKIDDEMYANHALRFIVFRLPDRKAFAVPRDCLMFAMSLREAKRYLTTGKMTKMPIDSEITRNDNFK